MLQNPAYNPFDSLAPIRNIDGYPEDMPYSIGTTLFLYGDSTEIAIDSIPVKKEAMRQDTSVLNVWKATRITTGQPSAISYKQETASEKYLDMGIVICLIIFFLIATERIVEGLTRAFWAAPMLSRQEEIDDELTLRSSRNISVLFLFPTALFAAAQSSWKFLTIMTLAGAYLALKYGILAILDYVNQTNVFKFLGRMGLNYLIIATPILFLSKINWYISLLCIIPAGLYLIMASRTITKNNFSVFFYILYICTLELLPAALLIRIFL